MNFTVRPPKVSGSISRDMNRPAATPPSPAGPGSQTFDAPGADVFTTPPGILTMVVECWGGGGGGGLAATASAGGGGGGAYARAAFAAPFAATYPLVVGAGGAVDSEGVDSTFNVDDVFAAYGNPGFAGGQGNGGNAGDCIGDVTRSGGNGAVSGGTGGGGGGSSAGPDAAGGNAVTLTGGIAPAGGGAGGSGHASAVGSPGSAPGGGGGGGAATTFTGGTGGAGRVKITWPAPD